MNAILILCIFNAYILSFLHVRHILKLFIQYFWIEVFLFYTTYMYVIC